ncbi:MAG: SLC13 family permease, partial [Planctomycetota bacterium]
MNVPQPIAASFQESSAERPGHGGPVGAPGTEPEPKPKRPAFFGRWGVWLALLVFATILLTDVPEGMTPAAHRTLAITALTAALWFTGAVPLGAASLVPLVAFPLSDVLSPQAASSAYVNKFVFLYLGGFLLALGLERWNVHERLALHTLRLTGSSPRRVVAGFMLAAAGLSMWISNTAATIMLLPVAVAMLDALGKTAAGANESDVKRQRQLTVALLLGLALAASLGGLATKIGTPTNVAFLGVWEESFGSEGMEQRFEFSKWLAAFGPVSAVLLLLAWGLLTWNLRPTPGMAAVGRAFFANRLSALGRLTSPERRMLLVFGLAAALWVVP